MQLVNSDGTPAGGEVGPGPRPGTETETEA